MRITHKLTSDHEQIRLLLAALREDCGNPAQVPPDAAAPLKTALQTHSWVEDIFFYPIFRTAIFQSPAARLSMNYMDILETEHKKIDEYLEQLEGKLTNDAPLKDRIESFDSLLIEIEGHFRKEESEVFPYAEELLGEDRLEALCDEVNRSNNAA